METYSDAKYQQVRHEEARRFVSQAGGGALYGLGSDTPFAFRCVEHTRCFECFSPFPVPGVLAALVMVQVKPYLEAEMCSRGAKVLSWDGTFATASQVDREAKVVVSALNELGHVLVYAAVTSEKWTSVLHMFFG